MNDIGKISFWAGLESTVPEGCIVCDGRCLPKVAYTELYAAIGDTFNQGQIDPDYFQIPNLRGQFIRCASNDVTNTADPDLPTRILPNGDTSTNPLKIGSLQSSTLQSHSHDVQDKGHTHCYNDYLNHQAGVPVLAHVWPMVQDLSKKLDTGVLTTSSNSNIVVLPSGSKETRPTNISLLPIIKVQATFEEVKLKSLRSKQHTGGLKKPGTIRSTVQRLDKKTNMLSSDPTAPSLPFSLKDQDLQLGDAMVSERATFNNFRYPSVVVSFSSWSHKIGPECPQKLKDSFKTLAEEQIRRANYLQYRSIESGVLFCDLTYAFEFISFMDSNFEASGEDWNTYVLTFDSLITYAKQRLEFHASAFDILISATSSSIIPTLSTSSDSVSFVDWLQSMKKRYEDIADRVSKLKDSYQDIANLAQAIKDAIGDLKAKQNWDASFILSLSNQLVDKFTLPTDNQKTEYENQVDQQGNQHAQRIADTIGQAFELVGDVAKIVGVPTSTVNKIVAVGSAVTKIASTIAQWTAISFLSGPLAPFVAIGGALVSLVSCLFGGSSSAEDGISKELGQISQQISQLGQHIDARLDVIDSALVSIYNSFTEDFRQVSQALVQIDQDINNGFNRLETIIGNAMGFIVKQLASVDSSIQNLAALLSIVVNQLLSLQKTINTMFFELYMQEYYDAKMNALNYYRWVGAKMSRKDAVQYYITFIRGCCNSNKDIPAGNSQGGDILTASDLASRLRASGISRSINYIAEYAHVCGGGIMFPSICNPAVWKEATDTLLQFLCCTPDLNLNKAAVMRALDDVSAVGHQYLQFIDSLISNQTLWDNLIQNYFNALQPLQEVFQDVLDAVPPTIVDPMDRIKAAHATIYDHLNSPSSDWTRLLQSLEDARTVFVSLANLCFWYDPKRKPPINGTPDLHHKTYLDLRVFIQRFMWNTDQLQQYAYLGSISSLGLWSYARQLLDEETLKDPHAVGEVVMQLYAAPFIGQRLVVLETADGDVQMINVLRQYVNDLITNYKERLPDQEDCFIRVCLEHLERAKVPLRL